MWEGDIKNTNKVGEERRGKGEKERRKRGENKQRVGKIRRNSPIFETLAIVDLIVITSNRKTIY